MPYMPSIFEWIKSRSPKKYAWHGMSACANSNGIFFFGLHTMLPSNLCLIVMWISNGRPCNILFLCNGMTLGGVDVFERNTISFAEIVDGEPDRTRFKGNHIPQMRSLILVEYFLIRSFKCKHFLIIMLKNLFGDSFVSPCILELFQ